jgi:hypothetical protein
LVSKMGANIYWYHDGVSFSTLPVGVPPAISSL